MRRLFQDVTKRLQAFLAQRDTLLLLVRCRDQECAFVIKQLDAIDEASPDFFWMFTNDFADAPSYVEALVTTFRERVGLLARKLAESGAAPWPPLPPAALDPKNAPVARLRLLLMYARTRIPDLEASNLVTVLQPLQILDALSWRLLLRDLATYDPLSPWCHHVRIIARENPDVSMDILSRDLRARLDPADFPSTEIYPVDFSLAALHRATKEEIADTSIPLPDRMQTLLVDANVDYSNRRYETALEKYQLLQTFYAAVGNHALLGATLNGMGEVYAGLGLREQAIAHFEMGITATVEGKSNAILLNISLNLGNLYLVAEQWAESAEHYIGAEALATALLNASTKLLCLENIGVCRMQLEDYAAAQVAWTNGAKLARALEEHDAARRLLTRLRDLYIQARMRDRQASIEAELRSLPS